jgi:hypothetical protein
MVYIIEAISGEKSLFKIGYTGSCPRQRLGQLERQNAFPVKLVSCMIGDKQDETNFHNAFKGHRVHNEWFSDFKGIRRLINDFPISLWEERFLAVSQGRMSFYELYELHVKTLLRN